jgi:demethylmenaquinone methyltransferase / 2-methoxy-6-polyprenyl-1,4-benzoquinol methylase
MDSKNYNIVDGFNTIAPAYDIANDAITLGLHRIWRKFLCRTAIKFTPKSTKLLDIATGTGEVILGIVSQRPDIHVVGIDASEGMLKVAREKIKKKAFLFQGNIELKLANALSIPYPDNTFHTVTVCWGMRNIRPHSAALREILRVLKPGGNVVILENGRPDFKLIRKIYNSYAKIIPIIGEKLSNLKPAYHFYTASIDNFPSGSQFVAELFDSGFMNAKFKTLGASIVYLYSAQKPAFR